MTRKDPQFRELTGAIQVKFRELREQGVGAVVKHASVVTPAEESFFCKLLAITLPLPSNELFFLRWQSVLSPWG